MAFVNSIKKILLLLSAALTVYFCVGKPAVWYEGRHEFIQRAEPLTHDDDSDYYYIAEKFWGLENDPGFVKIDPRYAPIAEAYPVRGIGLGSLAVAFQRTFGNGKWRQPFTTFVLLLNVAGFVVLAYGLASFFRSMILWPPIWAFLIDRYSQNINYPTAWCTEAVTRGLIPLLVGLAFLLVNRELRKSLFYSLGTLLVCLGPILCLFKIQWILGLGMMGAAFLLARQSRRVGVLILASTILAVIFVRGINYFGYDGNKELFASSGLFALTWSPDGAVILKTGCDEKRFPENVAGVVCDETPGTLWAAILNANLPKQDLARFFEKTSQINSELFGKNIGERIGRLTQSFRPVVKGIYFGIVDTTTKKKVFLSIVGFLFVISLVMIGPARWMIIGAMSLAFFSVWIPTMSVQVFWEYRYYVPIRGLMCVLPMLAILGAAFRFLSAYNPAFTQMHAIHVFNRFGR